MSKKIAYLGPRGTFTEEAALTYDSKAQMIPLPSVAAVGAAIKTGMVEEGVVAIENSIEGSVNDTLDLLIEEAGILIFKELVLLIEQHLLVKPGTQINEIKVIFSHPQALAQCRKFIEKCFPKAQLVAALSTTAAVEDMMASDQPAAAIGNKRAAEIYGAQIIAQRVQDRFPNLTRFVVLAKKDNEPSGHDKTSICFSFDEDRPGLLFSVLKVFAERNINLSKIESRPTKEKLGRYHFLIDLTGHCKDELIADTLNKVREHTSFFRVMGSYPAYSDRDIPL